jgi:hypothetical protein
MSSFMPFSVALSLLVGLLSIADLVRAQGGTEFAGTVLTVDATAGKLAVKKDGGGTRFTFVVNDKTKFEGGPAGLKDVAKGDHVVVTYGVSGSQYLAQKVSKSK